MSNEDVNYTPLWERVEAVLQGDVDATFPDFAIGYSTSRTPIPTGWIVQQTVYNDLMKTLSTSLVTIEDPTHTWIPKNREQKA